MHIVWTEGVSYALLQAVLRAICEAAKAVSTDRTASSSMQSFYAVLLCELLLTTQPVSPLLLPCIMLHRTIISEGLIVVASSQHGCGMMIMITITDLIRGTGCPVADTFHAPL